MQEHVDDVAQQPARFIGSTKEGTLKPSQAAMLRLQREAGNGAVGSMIEQERSPVLDIVGHGGGSSLSTGVRAAMEGAFGADFGGVRVHTGDSAAASARSVQAHAYTVGNDVVLADGVDPASAAGQRTLAHELTHVVQQRVGDVDGNPAGGGIRVSDPGDRFEQEAEQVAEQVTSDPTGTLPAIGAGAGVQREVAADEDRPLDENVQAQSLQREGDEDKLDEEASA